MTRKYWWPGLIMIIMAFAATALLYPSLPDPMPSHWNAAGEVDDYMALPWGALILPLVMLGTWLLFLALPAISPRGFRMSRFMGAYATIINTILAFLLLVSGTVLTAAMGYAVEINRVVPIGIGILFVVIGNYLGKTTRNFFLGIRTPWTLASDEVWRRTHRLAGWLFVLAGLIIAATGVFNIVRVWLFVGVVLVAALLPVIYSFFAYRQLEGFSDDDAQS
ncbi:MAG: SdpI family protein [Gammaproteobacteria bacterium]|nr:MAG: SdpI family protein [Gammaproteobacteria bacterium]